MGITRDEFKVIVKGLKVVYPAKEFIPDQDAFDIWYQMLSDIDYKSLQMAAQKYIMTEKWPPTIADLRKLCVTDEGINEQEACAMLRKAMRNGYYGAEQEYAKLPLEIQKAVGSPQNIREWCQLPSEDIETVIMSQFLRNYRTVLRRVEENAQLPERLRTLITATAQNLLPDKEQVIDYSDAVEPPVDMLQRVLGA